METSEFPVFEPGYGEGYGLDTPWVWITAILIGLIVLGAGYYFGRWRTRELMQDSRSRRVREAYHKIRKKSDEAKKAHRSEVMGKAQDLLNEINRYFSPFLLFAAPLHERVDGLAHTLQHGRAPKPKDEHGHEGHDDGQGAHGDHGTGHDDHAAYDNGSDHEHGSGDHAAQRTRTTVTIRGDNNVIVGGEPQKPGGPGPGGPHHPPSKPPTLDEQIDNVRRAVDRFHDFWGRPETRAELENAFRKFD